MTYHEHDCLLENKIEEQLSEEERKAAWEDYENEKKGAIRSSQSECYLQFPFFVTFSAILRLSRD